MGTTIKKFFIISVLFGADALNVFATNVIAQHPASVQYSNTNTVSKTYGSSCTSGSLLIAIFSSETTNALSVSDPTNGTWTEDVTTSQAATGRLSIFSVHNTASTALTVTGNPGATSYGSLMIYEVTGAPSSSYVDTTGSQNTINVPPSVTITAAANDTIIGAWEGYPNDGTPPDSGYTLDYGPVPVNADYHTGESIADSGGSGNKTLAVEQGGNKTQQCTVVAAYKTSGGVVAGGGIGKRMKIEKLDE